MVRKHEIASLFEDIKKEAGRNKTQRSRKQILKDLANTRDTYQSLRKDLNELKLQKEKLDKLIQDAKNGVHESRSNMLKMNQILQTMDIIDSNYAILYKNNDQDVAYIIDKEEYYADINDIGEANLTLMKDYLRNKRKANKENEELEELEELEDSNDADIIPGIQRLEDSAPRSEDNNITSFPNLRLLD